MDCKLQKCKKYRKDWIPTLILHYLSQVRRTTEPMHGNCWIFFDHSEMLSHNNRIIMIKKIIFLFTIPSLGILQSTLMQMIGKMNFLQMKASQCLCKCLIERLSIIGNYRSVGLGLNVGVLEDIAEILRAAFTELLSIWWCWEGKTLVNFIIVIHRGVTVPIGVGASAVVVGFSEGNII